MYDRGKIIAGILIFVGLFTFPFWYGRGKAGSAPKLEIETPVIQRLAKKSCVRPTPYMRANHMELLDSWRELVVREGKRFDLDSQGKKVAMSLSQNCLRCHSNKEKFCDVCHNYAGVQPVCWSCHVVPKET